MVGPEYAVHPLEVGRCMLGERHVLGDAYSDEDRIPFALYAFLCVAPDGAHVLVDLGPVGLEYTNEMFRRYGFFRDIPGRPDDIVQKHGHVFDHLARLGIEPSQIAHVVLTHIHADHHGMVDAKDAGAILRLPNARVHVSKTGWQYNLARRTADGWNSYVDHAFADFLLEAGRTGRAVFADDCAVKPGIEVFYLGGHSVCSQAVKIATRFGPAVVTSDDVYRYDLLERAVMARISTRPENLVAATDKLVRVVEAEDGILLPCHDPVLWDLYEAHGEGWLEHAKALTRRAITGYKARRS